MEMSGLECIHGQLARACNVCELENEIKRLTQQRDTLRAALEHAVQTCFTQYAHEQVMSHPSHFVNQALEKSK